MTTQIKNSVKKYTFLHVVDPTNLRYPSEFTQTRTCEATVFIRNGVVSVGNIGSFSFDLIYNIKSWCDLELDIIEEAKALYLD